MIFKTVIIIHILHAQPSVAFTDCWLTECLVMTYLINPLGPTAVDNVLGFSVAWRTATC